MRKLQPIPRFLSLSAAALTLGIVGVEARAGALESNGKCSNDHVTVTSVINQGDPAGTNLLAKNGIPSLSAADCLGAFESKKGKGGHHYNTDLGDNLGFANEGFFLNNKEFFPDHGAFVEEEDLQDLETEGEFVDPGWIFVSKIEFPEKGSKGEVETMGTVKKDVDGDGTKEEYRFAEDIFTMDCGKNSDGVDCTTGTWTLTPPKTNPDQLLSILGANKFFDQAALLLKGSTEYAIYNFSLSAAGLPPVIGDDPNFKFEGTWSTNALTNNGGNTPDLSHAILAFRDPTGGEVIGVPEPTTLALMGLGLFGLGGMSLRRRKG